MSKSYIPLYSYSLAEAMRNGESDIKQYRESHNENILCAGAIKKAISENFDSYTLKTDFAKDIVAEYGYDRVMFVLANTVQHFDYDGRISNTNKEWAKTFFIPEDMTQGSYNRNLDFIIDNPGLVDLVTNEVRTLFDKLNLWDVSHCNPARELNFENKIMVLKPEILKDEYKTPDYQLFYAQSGFGCSPTARGRKVFGQFLFDGKHTNYDRQDFIGELKPGLLPKWAADKVKDLQKPSIKKQLADMPKQKPEPKKDVKDKGAR